MPFFRPGQPDRSGMKRADKRNHGPYSVETPPADEPNAFGPPGLSHGGQGGVKTSPSTEQTGTVVIGEGTTCIGNVITMGTQSASVTGTGSGTAGASETITISSGTQGPSGISDSAGTSAPAATSATPGAGVMVESTRWDIVLGVAAVAGVVGLMI